MARRFGLFRSVKPESITLSVVVETVERVTARDAEKLAADKFGYFPVALYPNAAFEVSIVCFFKDADPIRLFTELFSRLTVKFIF